MKPDSQAILDAALALPEAEREVLIQRILETLPPIPGDIAEDEFAAELDRRFDEVKQDPSSAVPWSEVQRQV